jgi:predicted GIY-YIG superfamily endonuclease
VTAIQPRLFPDPCPLVDRLGRAFFRQVPNRPGVYLMCDEQEVVLYVGKAKDLRKRLGSYRVANADRLPRRILRLLSLVRRIHCHECNDEATALAREAELLRTLKPRFNRAGTWPPPSRFLAWNVTSDGLGLRLIEAPENGWHIHGPLKGGALRFRAALVRLLWCALHPTRGVTGLPTGWFYGQMGGTVTIPSCPGDMALLQAAATRLASLCSGELARFIAWVEDRTPIQIHPFARAAIDADVETLSEFFPPK